MTDHAPSRRELANGVRALAMDAVQKANSGHPGAPMGMADIAEVLWRDYLRHHPGNPSWWDRDRFVLSNGHGSMLQYALLHLTGYDVTLDDLKAFRQLHSRTPGHPEVHETPGVETTTGPLGQGLANAVGMALAEKVLAARFNRPGHTVVDHWTYCFLGDGCLMEGISHEACSLAGTQALGKLVAFYDDNGISIDGNVEQWFTEDVRGRFEAYGWHVVGPIDGHDAEAVRQAIEEARAETSRPSLIDCRTVIGFGSPNKCGTHDVHGAALGDDEVAATREKLGWSHAPFEIPAEHYAAWDAHEAGRKQEAAWEERLAAYRSEHPELAAEFERRMRGELPQSWERIAHEAAAALANGKKDATRKSSQAALNQLAPHLPELIGGSADLTGSNNTWWSGCKAIAPEDADGNYVFYGVREFGMTAVMNGLSLHGGVIPYGGTFLTFSDYARNAVRMAALMKVRSVLVYTHDSIGLGEDGPTHQSVEHLSSLRLIPNLDLWRPCDAQETAVAWAFALERTDGPTALALSRQGTEQQERDEATAANIRRGGYILADCPGTPEAVIIGTGSEVELAVAAQQALAGQGRRVRVVSMPCVSVFERQDAAYRSQVLPEGVPRVVVEAGVTALWRAWTAPDGDVVGIDQYGASAPGGDVYREFGITADAVTERVQAVLGR